jgi:hypothetical protein
MHPDKMGITKETAKTTKLLKLQPYKTIVVHSLQPHNSNFWDWYLIQLMTVNLVMRRPFFMAELGFI